PRVACARWGGFFAGGGAGSRNGRPGHSAAAGRCAEGLERAHRRAARRGDARASARSSVPVVRQAGRAQRTPGLHAGGNAVYATNLSGRALVNALADARTASAWAALQQVEDPEIPAV